MPFGYRGFNQNYFCSYVQDSPGSVFQLANSTQASSAYFGHEDLTCLSEVSCSRDRHFESYCFASSSTPIEISLMQMACWKTFQGSLNFDLLFSVIFFVEQFLYFFLCIRFVYWFPGEKRNRWGLHLNLMVDCPMHWPQRPWLWSNSFGRGSEHSTLPSQFDYCWDFCLSFLLCHICHWQHCWYLYQVANCPMKIHNCKGDFGVCGAAGWSHLEKRSRFFDLWCGLPHAYLLTHYHQC